MNNIKVVLIAVLLLVLVVLLGGGAFLLIQGYWVPRSATTYSSTNTPYSALVKNNPPFVQAQSAANAGQYDLAKSLYQQALTQAQDSVQKGQIEFKLALLEDRWLHYIPAIDQYKAIVANPDYDNYRILKAYALQNMAELYYRNGDPTVTREIFKDAPYAQMVVSGDSSLTYRHLEEYSTTFYPLAMPELRIATWYAEHINATSTPDGIATSSYPTIIQSAIKLADADINRTKTDVNAAAGIPAALVRKASLYVRMYEGGIANVQDAEQACRGAVNIFAAMGSSNIDGYARYYYAILLSQLGPSRVSDLQHLLAPFYTTTAYHNSAVFAFFASEKDNRLGQKTRLVKIASLDPEFKRLLISLGWSTSDF